MIVNSRKMKIFQTFLGSRGSNIPNWGHETKERQAKSGQKARENSAKTYANERKHTKRMEL